MGVVVQNKVARFLWLTVYMYIAFFQCFDAVVLVMAPHSQ